MSTGDSFSKLTIAIVETSVPNVGQNIMGKTLEQATNVLSGRGLELLYESRTSVLNASQRKLYERILTTIPSKLAIFVDPIIISFALKDACDRSSSEYIWLDLEGNDDIGNAVWTEKTQEEDILRLMSRFLRNHLEKYVIDAYDRLTREDMARVWEAQIDIKDVGFLGLNNQGCLFHNLRACPEYLNRERPFRWMALQKLNGLLPLVNKTV